MKTQIKNKNSSSNKNHNNNKNKSSQKKKNENEIKKLNELDNYNFFNFDNNKNKEENYIDADKLIKELKEEAEDTKILLKKLSGRKQQSRDFMKEMEQEKLIKERYNTKKNLMIKKENDKYNRMVKVIKDPINIKRTNKIENKLNNNLEEYENDKKNNLDFNKKLSLQYAIYIDNINSVDNEKIKKQAENKYIKFQNENKMKIKQRKKEEEKRKKHLLKLQKDNEKYQLLVKNNFKMIKDDTDLDLNKNKNNLLFQEEKNVEGTNMSPDMINNDNDKSSNINKKYKKAKSSARMKLEKGICQLPRVNENLNFGAHEELSDILKNELDKKKKLEKLLIFKKKYKYFDISSYIQTGKMSDIHNAKVVRIKHEDISIYNNNPNFNFNFEIGKKSENDIIIYRNYLQSCKYNNNEHIQAYLLQAKNDIEVWTMVNERDEYNRNGLMYLLIHNNINMIKLTLLSGVTLDDKTDIFGRNLIHYCCTNIVDHEMLNIICHCIDFKTFSDLCIYVDKCIPIDNNNIEKNDVYTEEYQLSCEEKIKNFDDLIGIKEKILIEKGIIKKDEENDYYDYNYNQNKEKNYLIEVKREIKDPYENIHKRNINISNIVNSPDLEGNYPLHYLVNNNINNFDKIQILVYFHAKVYVLNSLNKKAIDLTNNKKIQQFLLNQEKNITSKESLKGSNKNNINNNFNKSTNKKFNNSNISSMFNVSTSIDIDEIKYYTPEKINSFYVGVQKNNYLILSVIQQDYELFKFLLIEKNAKADYINENGWSILNFIILKKLWNFFSFLFQLPDECNTTEKIYNELNKIKKFDKKIIIQNNKNKLTYTGSALSVIDKMTKNHNNLLSLCIDELNDLFLFKSLIILYENYIEYFIINQNKDLLNNEEKYKQEQDKIYHSFITNVFNKEYGKNKETLLIKSIKKNNIEMFKHLLYNINFNNKKINLDIYKTDFNGQNILHYAVQLKQKETILFLVKYDSDYNKLITTKDIKGKTPLDFDRTKSFENELYSIWDAAKDNNINVLNKIIKELNYYDINEQTIFKGNTALHIAVKNKADKFILYLILNSADKNIKNKKGFTAFESIKKEKNVDKKWIEKVKKILDGKIKYYTDLDSCNFDKLVKNEENIKFTEKMNIVNGNIKNIYKEEKNKKDNNLSKLSKGISFNPKLRELLNNICKNIKKNNINLDEIIKNYDKNDSGVLENNDFDNLFNNIDKNMNNKDLSFLKYFLDKDKNNCIKYKELISLIKD